MSTNVLRDLSPKHGSILHENLEEGTIEPATKHPRKQSESNKLQAAMIGIGKKNP